MEILRRTLMILVIVVLGDETIGHYEGFRQPRKPRDFGNRTRGQFGQRGNLHSVRVHDDSCLEERKM